MTEVWFRNPLTYIRELAELNVGLLAWDRGFLAKRGVHVRGFSNLYFAQNLQWRALLVGPQGTAELRREHSIHSPAAVYPTWQYGDGLDVLEGFLAAPAGENAEVCQDTRIPIDERPVAGQEHRVVVTDLPPANTGPGRAILRILAELQQDNPEAILHIHGLYGFGAMFGREYGAVDYDPRVLAQKGKVVFPSGQEVTFERAGETPMWIHLLGFRVGELEVPRNRCLYNIKSAIWAGENYRHDLKFRTDRMTPVDPDAIEHVPAETQSHLGNARASVDGDRFLCDLCSLAPTCKYYRTGSVCTLPDADTKELIEMFGSRQADDIVDGLSRLMEIQVERLKKGLDNEDPDDLDPELSKLISRAFADGVKLAKLRNPKLAGGPLVGINLNVPRDVLEAARPAELTGIAVKALESQGIPREDITSEMIQRVLAPALEAASTVVDEERHIEDAEVGAA